MNKKIKFWEKAIKELEKDYIGKDEGGKDTCSANLVDKPFGENCGGCESAFVIKFIKRHIEFLKED